MAMHAPTVVLAVRGLTRGRVYVEVGDNLTPDAASDPHGAEHTESKAHYTHIQRYIPVYINMATSKNEETKVTAARIENQTETR